MSLITDLESRVAENNTKLEVAHKWLWEHTEHHRFTEQSTRYNALDSLNNDLTGLLGLLKFYDRFRDQLLSINIITVGGGTSDLSYMSDVEQEVSLWIKVAEESYDESIGSVIKE